jgi:hypothetical protein
MPLVDVEEFKRKSIPLQKQDEVKASPAECLKGSRL